MRQRTVFGPAALDDGVIHPAPGVHVDPQRRLALVNRQLIVEPGNRAHRHAVRNQDSGNAGSAGAVFNAMPCGLLWLDITAKVKGRLSNSWTYLR